MDGPPLRPAGARPGRRACACFTHDELERAAPSRSPAKALGATFRGAPLADLAQPRPRHRRRAGSSGAPASTRTAGTSASTCAQARRRSWRRAGAQPTSLVEGLEHGDGRSSHRRSWPAPDREDVARLAARMHHAPLPSSPRRSWSSSTRSSSPSEFALVKIRPTRLEQLIRQRRRPRPPRAAHHRTASTHYLSATQLGVTLASLGLGWIGEPAIAHALQPRLPRSAAGPSRRRTPSPSPSPSSSSRAIHTIIGELAPKSLAIQHTEQVALHSVAAAARLLPAGVAGHLAASTPGANGLHPPLRPRARGQGGDPRTPRRSCACSSPRAPPASTPTLRSMLVRVFDLRRRTARNVDEPAQRRRP